MQLLCLKKFVTLPTLCQQFFPCNLVLPIFEAGHTGLHCPVLHETQCTNMQCTVAPHGLRNSATHTPSLVAKPSCIIEAVLGMLFKLVSQNFDAGTLFDRFNDFF